MNILIFLLSIALIYFSVYITMFSYQSLWAFMHHIFFFEDPKKIKLGVLLFWIVNSQLEDDLNENGDDEKDTEKIN